MRPAPEAAARTGEGRSDTVSTRPPAAPAGVRRQRRWHRIAIPLGAAALLLAGTVISHAVDQPDPTDSGFLSPVNSDDDGGSQLADRLRAAGITVERTTSTREALPRAYAEGSTLFVPAPGLVHPLYLPYLTEPAGHADGTRVVLVDPPQRVLDATDLPLAATGRRWAARAVGADADGEPCPLREAVTAGRAAALLQRYRDLSQVDDRTDYCYSGGLARTAQRDGDIVVIGASDPFRNDRLAEWGNAALATGLLGGHERVVWLDLAGPEPPPPHYRGGGLDPWTSGPDGSETYQGEEPEEGDGDPEYEEQAEPPPRKPDPQGAPPKPRNPLWDALPQWFWAVLVQLALALLVAVLWRARRLGPPVAEPLPVSVPAAETVYGRARLYQRARAYGPAARTLRAAALHRLAQAGNLPADARPDELAAAVAARTGRDAAEVHDLLYGPAPETNRELLDLARALDVLAGRAGDTRDDRPASHAGQPTSRTDRPAFPSGQPTSLLDQSRHDRHSEGEAR
ncbi:DUF4350 domain-containing protein [Plantactinospora sp. WMMC1484]|uniref:DUF4350 domain-containing protein n=1 Tax=Plantactinospora sp. WMMC1484 TaxID=3404122 RepID=UPI003BF4CE04